MKKTPLSSLVGKTIASIIRVRNPKFEDTGWLKLGFTDGTSVVIKGGYYEQWRTNSMKEYLTEISVAPGAPAEFIPDTNQTFAPWEHRESHMTSS